MGAEPPPALQSPELLGPRPLGQQSAARPSASPTMASSGSSSTSSGTFALGPWGRITSQGICGWPGQGFSANVSTSPPPENGGDPSDGPARPHKEMQKSTEKERNPQSISEPDDLTESEQKIYRILQTDTAMSVDEICNQTEIPFHELFLTLQMLEMKQLIQSEIGSRYKKRTNQS